MYKSIFYKEWIKLRRVFFVFLVLGAILAISAWLYLSHVVKFSGAVQVWDMYLYRGQMFYSKFIQYFPVVVGLLLGVSQFVPEITAKRIKLVFRLPIGENIVILTMLGIGVLYVAVILGVMLAFVLLTASIVFPYEVVNSLFVSILPWMMGGLVAYFFTSLVILEPIWRYRICYIPIGFGLVKFFLYSGWYNAYEKCLGLLIVSGLVLGVVVLYSATRFRKGVM
ncbi:hypothetical protein EYV94_18645 [Puteibacter caeruleilacunae]|nr:hypothetical protein EYV94_18645 [Puteibacter caeruleilacunae]